MTLPLLSEGYRSKLSVCKLQHITHTFICLLSTPHVAFCGIVIVYVFIILTVSVWVSALRKSHPRNHSTSIDNTDIVIMYSKIFREPIINAIYLLFSKTKIEIKGFLISNILKIVLWQNLLHDANCKSQNLQSDRFPRRWIFNCTIHKLHTGSALTTDDSWPLHSISSTEDFQHTIQSTSGVNPDQPTRTWKVKWSGCNYELCVSVNMCLRFTCNVIRGCLIQHVWNYKWTGGVQKREESSMTDEMKKVN